MQWFAGDPRVTGIRTRIAQFVAQQRMTFALVEEGKKPREKLQILERHSGKTLGFNAGSVTHLEEARDTIRGGRYLRIQLDDGRNFALAGMGFVFEPSFVSTGPLVDCPPTSCMRDYEKLARHLSHLVNEADQGPNKEATQVIMILLAYLDGARAIGLDISPEEQKLEQQLSRLETQKKGAG